VKKMKSAFRHCSAIIVIVVLDLVYFNAVSSAQQYLSRIHGRPDVSTAFNQDFNVYAWRFGLNYWKAVSNSLEISVREKWNSSMLRLGAGNEKWKDEHKLDLHALYKMNTHWQLFTNAYSNTFTDQQSGFRNNIIMHYIGGGITHRPQSNVKVQSYIGNKWDRRYWQYDRGLNFGLAMNADRIDLGGYVNELSLDLWRDKFQVRQNRNLQASYAVFRKFSPGTTDSLSVRFERRRRDNYLSTAGDVETYEEELQSLRNMLRYKVADKTRLDIANSLVYKSVDVIHYGEEDDDEVRRRRDQRFEHLLRLHSKIMGGDIRVQLHYWTQEQRYDIPAPEIVSPFSPRAAFIAPDNNSSRFTLLNDMYFRLSASDSIASRFSISRFQYDTPDTSNFDDRDELRINATLMGEHVFNAALKLQVIASVNLYHMVYLYAEHSADNNWNRIFRLAAQLYFQPSKRFKMFHSAKVLANYVAYDFENIRVQTRSFSFRKFVAEDSLSWRFSNRSIMKIHVRGLLEENARFYYEEWAERPLLARTNLWAKALLQYRVYSGVYLSSGFMFYQRDGWRYNFTPEGEMSKESYETYISRGPIFRFMYRPSANVNVAVRATRQQVNPTGQKRYYLNNIDMVLNWYL